MKIVLIDDHKLFLQSLQKLLNEQNNIESVKVYESADHFLEDFPLNPPDIILTDLQMPGEINGMQLIKLCLEKYLDNKPNVIVLSSITDAQTIKQAIRSGAKGFLSKNIPIEELLEALILVNDNNQYISKELRNTLLNTLFTEEQIVYHLSPREKIVLQNVCSGLTIKEIAYNLNLSKHTVQYYHKNVLAKLKLKRTSDLIVFAMQNGLYIPDIDKKQ